MEVISHAHAVLMAKAIRLPVITGASTLMIRVVRDDLCLILNDPLSLYSVKTSITTELISYDGGNLCNSRYAVGSLLNRGSHRTEYALRINFSSEIL